MPRGNWASVPIPKELLEQIDEIVENDRYPTGQWHSRSHYIIQAVKEKLEREEADAHNE